MRGSINTTMTIAYSHDVMEKLEKWLLPSNAGIHMYMYMHAIVIGGDRERAPHLIVRRTFI